jgi:1-acyl-sn-glycerol-3-phosphate acyltransferase
MIAGVVAAFLAGLARLVLGTSVFWTEQPTTEPRIYVANHSSHLDFIVLWAVLPPEVRARTRPVAAADYWRGGMRRYLADKVFHAVLIDRGTPHAPEEAGSAPGEAPAAPDHASAIDQMLAALDEGSSLILFPEGTRGRAGELAAFRKGLYHACAARPAIPVVPVFMANLNRILPKGTKLPVPLLSRVTMGPPLLLESNEPKEVFLARARAAVVQLVDA